MTQNDITDRDLLISQFIDDELNIEEKIEFVEVVHTDGTFKDETVAFLRQERLLRAEVVQQTPALPVEARRRISLPDFRWLLAWGTTALAAIVILFVLFARPEAPEQREAGFVPYRFVVYRPGSQRADIAGSFSDWKAIPLKSIPGTGYWEVTLRLNPGEYRFTYILDGTRKWPDPTLPEREPDDFGGENSILKVAGI